MKFRSKHDGCDGCVKIPRRLLPSTSNDGEMLKVSKYCYASECCLPANIAMPENIDIPGNTAMPMFQTSCETKMHIWKYG